MIIIDRQGDFESSQEGGGKEGPDIVTALSFLIIVFVFFQNLADRYDDGRHPDKEGQPNDHQDDDKFFTHVDGKDKFFARQFCHECVNRVST